MRFALPLRRTLFVAVVILFALLALVPLRFAIGLVGFDRAGLTARAATGSIWLGALHDARIGPIPLGDVRTRLHMLPLLIGEGRLHVAARDAEGIEGTLVRTRNSFGFDDVSGRVGPASLIPPVPLAGIELDDLGARFAEGRCIEAGGRVRVTLAGPAAALGIPVALSGTARCAGDTLLLPLAGQSGLDRFDIRVKDDGRYQIDLIVGVADARLAPAFLAAGFRRSGSGYRLRVNGAF